MAGNIGGEFNLAVWRISGRSAKISNGDFADLVLYTAAATVPDPAHAKIAVPRSGV